MIQRYGNMFDHQHEATVLVVTTNNTITSKGKLVMGKGAAKQLRDALPGIDFELGQKITSLKKWSAKEDYLFITHLYNSRIIGLLQVKRHFRDAADFDLIAASLDMFKYYARGMRGSCPDCKIFINFPGIGAGKLANKESEILKILKKLPDNVHVWKFN